MKHAQNFQKSTFKASETIKMTVFEASKLPNLISRKIFKFLHYEVLQFQKTVVIVGNTAISMETQSGGRNILIYDHCAQCRKTKNYSNLKKFREII